MQFLALGTLIHGWVACRSTTLTSLPPGPDPAPASGGAPGELLVREDEVPVSAVAQPSRIIPVVIESVEGRGLGESFGIHDSMADLDAWIAVKVRDLRGPGLLFEPEILPPPAAVPEAGFKIRVTKAYVHRVFDTKSGVVVLTLDGPDGAVHFRAQTTSLNWMSAPTEFHGAIRKALGMALEQLTAHMIVEARRVPPPSATHP